MKTRHIELQHIQNSALNEVNRNKTEFLKIRAEESNFRQKILFVLVLALMVDLVAYILLFYVGMNIGLSLLIVWHYSRGSGLDLLCCRTFGRSLGNYANLCYDESMM